MNDPFEELILQAKRDRNLYAKSEEATKQGIVLPFLSKLGWDRDNISEVTPEYSVGTGRVDYCLRRGDEALVFVEVKRTGEPLDIHQEQLLRYSFDRGVTLAVLTDGIRWWLYLPTQPGSWDKRRFFTIDLEGQVCERVVSHLRQFLDKSATLSGAALRAAQDLHADRTIGDLIKKAIPLAWRELCEQPDIGLIELLSEKVEGHCGHRPDPEVLEEFITGVATGYVGREGSPRVNRDEKKSFKQPEVRNIAPQGHSSDRNWTSQKAISFTFLEQDYMVRRFKDILLGLAGILYERNPAEFWSRVNSLRTKRGKAQYTQEPDRLITPVEIEHSGIYVVTCLNANAVRDRCHELLAAYDYPAHDLRVQLRSKN